jgi:DNA-binding SARP family transcriptional activator
MSLFGTFRIERPEGAILPITRAAQSLLAYLLLHGDRLHSREALAGVFWGNHRESQARSCLSTTLWRLRRALEPQPAARGTYLTVTGSGQIGFNRSSPYCLDVEVLESEVTRALSAEPEALSDADAAQLEGALALYKGDLLESFFDDWALFERERLRGVYVDGLFHLLNLYIARGAGEQGLAAGRKILQHDSLREDVHQLMMKLYLECGQRTRAVNQYLECRAALQEGLGIAPMQETEGLLNGIAPGSRAVKAPAGNGHSTLTPVVNLNGAVAQLRRALRELEVAKEQVEQAARLLERATAPLAAKRLPGEAAQAPSNSSYRRSRR